MAESPELFDNPSDVRDNVIAEISSALLREAQEVVGQSSVPPKKKRSRRKRGGSVSNPVVASTRGNRQRAQRPESVPEVPEVGGNPLSDEFLQIEEQELTATLETSLQKLRDTLASDDVSVPVEESVWKKRQLLAGMRAETARPMLLNAMLSSRRTVKQVCHKCHSGDAVIRCLECVPLDLEYLCPACDVDVHSKAVFHNREAIFNGFQEPIPPTKAVVLDNHGQPIFAEQVCQLPIPVCKPCACSGEARVTTGKHVLVVTMNGRYDTYFPRRVCSTCSRESTPGVEDLLAYRYWPSTINCNTLYRFDVFEAFRSMKLSSPSLSRHAFLKLLEHQSVQAGRPGKICEDMFQRSYFEYCLCIHEEEVMCGVNSFSCPACQPHMLAICCDGNRKHYRFAKSKGTNEPSLYENLFIARDEDVQAFVNKVRGSSLSRANDSGMCGGARFRASKESSKKSTSKIDEEGLQVAVCRHGILLRGLNHYRGEIFAYPMYIQREIAERANVTFFAMDVVCRYWPYLSRVVENNPELQPLAEMKPFLSVMHAKAHTPKCEIRWSGRNLDGAGNTVGEEVEQVNSFLSRAAVVTKYMTKSGRENMITQQAMAWNQKKTDNLHKAIAHRFLKVNERAKVESASLADFQEKNKLDQETIQKWVRDVQEWAVTDRVYTQGSLEDLRAEIETITVTLLRLKQDLYRQHDSNQTRQKKRRKIRDFTKKLGARISQYNEGLSSDDDRIDEELALNLTVGYILPWEKQEDGNSFRLKRSVFDRVMLVRRLEEEQSILAKEMSQHVISLRKEMKCLEKLKEENSIGNPSHMSEEASDGFLCILTKRATFLKQHCRQAVETYRAIVDGIDFSDPDTDSEEGSLLSSPESEEEEC